MSSNGRSPFAFGSNEDINEYFDEPEVLQKKVIALVQLIRESKHMVAYTGAGISTSAKIPDYRSPTRGVWTAKEFGLAPPPSIPLTLAVPTLGHVSLQKLVEMGILSFITSTNVDGLHRRAGTTRDKLSELHGNVYLEKCSKCSKEFWGTSDIRFTGRGDHLTGRLCDIPECKGPLMDSIINFGEDLPSTELLKATQQSELSDLSLVLGTSMRVSPANKLPLFPAKKGTGKLVICNLQKTPYDHLAAIRIFGPTDIVLKLVMEGLGLEIPTKTPEGEDVYFPLPYSDTRPPSGVLTRTSASASASTSSSSSSSSSSSAVGSEPAPQFFAVDPKTDCPHVASVVGNDCRIVVDISAPCRKCGDPTENWLCLTCGRVFCSRYVQGHAAAHAAENPDHFIATSFSDLSFWCYGCDDYIKHKDLTPVFRAIHLSKFGH